jgi:hypothetical protein
MNLWDQLNDFSYWSQRTPCALCKGESIPTLVGEHFKCQTCSHIFNKDGSEIGVECYCDACKPKEELEIPMTKDLKKKVGRKKKK